MEVVHVVAVPQVVGKAVKTPLAVKLTTELAVNPLPFTVRFKMLEAPALAVNGEIEVMPKAACPPRFRSHTPRPCVAARSVREGSWSASPKISAAGSEFAEPSTDQVAPPVVVKKAPISVPT
jgi:hypothetical protein